MPWKFNFKQNHCSQCPGNAYHTHIEKGNLRHRCSPKCIYRIFGGPAPPTPPPLNQHLEWQHLLTSIFVIMLERKTEPYINWLEMKIGLYIYCPRTDALPRVPHT